ncbi:hypothetical protein QR680_018085 [Steinernema hermaphroditum]|uniref:Uncharacterized protein n=1 Tax=Steinernema hermaphroditum TaxID=289476 RepID=A0AA39HI57_9BILA|nr:hypothetical protein QR680_018085 [Steinernema hermaphroditum]
MDNQSSPLENLKRWPDAGLTGLNKEIANCIYQNVPIYYPLNKVIDNKWFQRLDKIKLLGVVHLVYPTANHSLFDAAIGRYHQAIMFLNHQQVTVDVDRNIYSLAVCLAALCLDLGSPPYDFVEFKTIDDSFYRKKILKRSAEIFEKFIFPELFEDLKDLKPFYLNDPDEILLLTKKLIRCSAVTESEYASERHKFFFQLFGGFGFPITLDRLARLLLNSEFTDVGIETNQRYVYNFLCESNSELRDNRIVFASKSPILKVVRSEETLAGTVLHHKAVGGFQLKLFRAFELYENLKGDLGEVDLDELFLFTDSFYRRVIGSARVNSELEEVAFLFKEVFEERQKYRTVSFGSHGEKGPLVREKGPKGFDAEQITQQIEKYSKGRLKRGDFYVKVFETIPSDLQNAEIPFLQRRHQVGTELDQYLLIYDCSRKGSSLKEVVARLSF